MNQKQKLLSVLTLIFMTFTIGGFAGIGAFYTDIFIFENNLESALVFSNFVALATGTVYLFEAFPRVKEEWQIVENEADN